MQCKWEHLGPILVGHSHLLHDFLDVFIGSLNCPIHLRPIRRGIMVLDFEIVTHFLHHFVVQIGGIINDNFPRQPISADYLLFDEPDHHIPSHTSI